MFLESIAGLLCKCKIYVQLHCYCCGRILGNIGALLACVKSVSNRVIARKLEREHELARKRLLLRLELCKNINFAMETKAKKLNCLSSYYGRLNRLSLGQISELLRLRKESYCNVKLKWPDTGQHTVLVGYNFIFTGTNCTSLLSLKK